MEQLQQKSSVELEGDILNSEVMDTGLDYKNQAQVRDAILLLIMRGHIYIYISIFVCPVVDTTFRSLILPIFLHCSLVFST